MLSCPGKGLAIGRYVVQRQTTNILKDLLFWSKLRTKIGQRDKSVKVGRHYAYILSFNIDGVWIGNWSY
jgi:hypothetical protein